MPPSEGLTVVITGASAGVGRASALAFARRGWNVALLARQSPGLESAAREVEQAGGQAMAIGLDVADAEAVLGAAETVVRRWSAIDVWVNNAMVTLFAPLSEIAPAEFRRVTDVTYLGYVFGTMAALKQMRARNSGTIVQVGSALSYRAIPLQSAYCGAKFAIRGFTDALRSELEHDRSAVRLTMVQLPAVNTPQFDWARNRMPGRAQPLSPIHQPEAVAEAVFRASRQAPRELWVGFTSVKAILGTMAAPGFLDKLLAHGAYEGQLAAGPRSSEEADNLFESLPAGHAVHGRFDDRARSTVAAFNPSVLRVALPLAGAAVLMLAGAILSILVFA